MSDHNWKIKEMSNVLISDQILSNTYTDTMRVFIPSSRSFTLQNLSYTTFS